LNGNANLRRFLIIANPSQKKVKIIQKTPLRGI